MTLPPVFLDTPIAHRGLHDRSKGRVENSRASFQAAITAGFGIELDLQLSLDNIPMVFHDYELSRLTADRGAVKQRTRDELNSMVLSDSDDGIDDLASILRMIDGRAPVLIELKDQDGAMGPNVGHLEDQVAAILGQYAGPVAVMSFNPNSMIEMARLAPSIPRGLVTSAYDPKVWPLPRPTLNHLRDIPDYDKAGASFISHEASDLSRDRVAQLKGDGASILCWTISSDSMAQTALNIADNITFEGYLPS